MDEIRKSGKTIDEAVAAALAELQAEKDEVTITVIEEGSKGFLGMFGGKDAVVLVKKNFNPEKAAENFLREVFLSMGLIIKIETKMPFIPFARSEYNTTVCVQRKNGLPRRCPYCWRRWRLFVLYSLIPR